MAGSPARQEVKTQAVPQSQLLALCPALELSPGKAHFVTDHDPLVQAWSKGWSWSPVGRDSDLSLRSSVGFKQSCLQRHQS